MARVAYSEAPAIVGPAPGRAATTHGSTLPAPLLPSALGLGWFLLVLLPFIAGARGVQPGMVFSGTLKALGDESVYMAAVRQGAQGNWLWHDPYMVHPPPPILMYPTYMAFGKLGAALRLSVQASYALMHAAAALALLAALWRLGALVLPRRSRPWFVALALGMSGLYWLDELLGLGGSAPVSLVWLAMPQLGGLTSALMGAHETLGTAGQVLVLAGLVGAQPTGDRGGWSATALGAGGTLLVGLTLPMLLPVTLAACGLFALWWISRRPAAERRAAWHMAIPRVGLIALPALPIAAYYLWELRYGPWAGSPLLYTSARPLPEALLQWGVTLPLAAWGWHAAPPAARSLANALGLWCCCALAMIALPFWQGYRASTGLTIMAGALFALGLLRPAISARWRTRALLAVSLGAVLHYCLLLPLLASGGAHALYVSADQRRAMVWLAGHGTPHDVVLAPIGFSNLLPTVASPRLVAGHVFLTFDTARRDRQLHVFYGAGGGIAAREAILRDTEATYVVYDATDPEDGPYDPGALSGLRPAFTDARVIIYRVERRWPAPGTDAAESGR